MKSSSPSEINVKGKNTKNSLDFMSIQKYYRINKSGISKKWNTVQS